MVLTHGDQAFQPETAHGKIYAMRLVQHIAVIFLLIWAPGCSQVSEITTGAWAEVRSELTFSGNSDSTLDNIKPQQVPELAKVVDDIVCAYIDPATSYVSLLEYQGEDGVNFTLEARLVDEGVELDYFSWSGVLQANSKQVPLTDKITNFNPEAADRLAQILTRPDSSYQVRYSFKSDLAAEHVKAVFVQTLRVATENSSCP